MSTITVFDVTGKAMQELNDMIQKAETSLGVN